MLKFFGFTNSLNKHATWAVNDPRQPKFSFPTPKTRVGEALTRLQTRETNMLDRPLGRCCLFFHHPVPNCERCPQSIHTTLTLYLSFFKISVETIGPYLCTSMSIYTLCGSSGYQVPIEDSCTCSTSHAHILSWSLFH